MKQCTTDIPIINKSVLETSNLIEKKKKSKSRQGNIEFLRIICMVLIIIHHYCIHGGLVDAELTIGKKLICFFGENIGKIASDAFVLITGFFLFKSEFKIQKILKLIFEVIFYSLIVNLLMVVIQKNYVYIKYIKYAFFPLFFEVNWFVLAYVGSYFLFLKPVLSRISKEKYLGILCVLGIFISVIPTIVNMTYKVSHNPYGEFITFLYIVMIGGYLGKFNIKIFKKKRYNFIAILLMFIVFGEMGQLSMTNSVFTIILAVLILDLFLKIKIKSNMLIRFFSLSSLGVLLIHDNIFFNELMWNTIFKTQEYVSSSTINLIAHIYLCTISIYIVGAIIDFIRRNTIEELISEILDNMKIIKKINNCFNVNGDVLF